MSVHEDCALAKKSALVRQTDLLARLNLLDRSARRESRSDLVRVKLCWVWRKLSSLPEFLTRSFKIGSRIERFSLLTRFKKTFLGASCISFLIFSQPKLTLHDADDNGHLRERVRGILRQPSSARLTKNRSSLGTLPVKNGPVRQTV